MAAEPLRHLVVVLGDQLDRDAAVFDGFDPARDAVWMAEVDEESTHVWSSKPRTALFLSAMRHFAQALRDEGLRVHYRQLDDAANAGTLHGELAAALAALRPVRVRFTEPGEYRVREALRAAVAAAGVPLDECDDRHFLCSRADFAAHAKGRKQLRMEFFYREMRRRHRVLMEGDEPAGGAWNFDADNRAAFGRDGPGFVPQPARFEPDDLTPGRPEHGGRSAPREGTPVTAALSGDAPLFEPTPAAAQARLAAVNPAAYARSRNFLDGAVTRLSPYLTHGLLTLPEVLRAVAARHAIDVQHKLVYELGWREYFRHVWRHEGEGIFESLHEGPLPDAAYARTLPADLRRGATGVPVIDAAVRTLYTTGWLHNHARMWLASYVVHLRKLHWRAGADWMFGHLLDGDLASNHLSWQWVAGTGSHKPYLFNADNVAKYAPGWASPGSVIDVDYEALDRIARSPGAVLPAKGANKADAVDEPPLWAEPPPSLAAAFGAPDPATVAGRDVWLMHPFALGEPPPGRTALGVFVADFHRRWPWSEARWRFVAERLSAACAAVWWVDAATLAAPLAAARSVHALDDPHLTPWLRDVATLQPAPSLFADPSQSCASFSQFWSRVTKRVSHVQDLPGFADPATMPR